MKLRNWFTVFVSLLTFGFPYLQAHSSMNDSSLITQDLEIEISCENNSFVQGQLIDVLVRIKNNTGDTVKLYLANHHLYSHEDSKTINSLRNTVDYLSLIIFPHNEYIYLVDPLQFINYKKEDKGLLPGLPWYYWPEGNYDYYISYKLNKVVCTSNKITITIEPPSDSLISDFEALKTDLKNPDLLNTSTYKFESLEHLYGLYKGTFYEKEFLYKLLINWNYTYAIANKNEAKTLRSRAMELYKEFILKYPNTEGAIFYFGNIYAYRDKGNENLLKEILTSLKNDDSANIFWRVVNNQKRYRFKDLNSYGF